MWCKFTYRLRFNPVRLIGLLLQQIHDEALHRMVIWKRISPGISLCMSSNITISSQFQTLMLMVLTDSNTQRTRLKWGWFICLQPQISFNPKEILGIKVNNSIIIWKLWPIILNTILSKYNKNAELKTKINVLIYRCFGSGNCFYVFEFIWSKIQKKRNITI